MAEAKKCFAHFSDEELVSKQKKVQNPSTLKNKEAAERLLKEYLREVGAESDNFYTFTEKELDKHLQILVCC